MSIFYPQNNAEIRIRSTAVNEVKVNLEGVGGRKQTEICKKRVLFEGRRCWGGVGGDPNIPA